MATQESLTHSIVDSSVGFDPEAPAMDPELDLEFSMPTLNNRGFESRLAQFVLEEGESGCLQGNIMPTIRAAMGTGRKKIGEAIGKLEKEGLLEVTRRGTGSPITALRLDLDRFERAIALGRLVPVDDPYTLLPGEHGAWDASSSERDHQGVPVLRMSPESLERLGKLLNGKYSGEFIYVGDGTHSA